MCVCVYTYIYIYIYILYIHTPMYTFDAWDEDSQDDRALAAVKYAARRER